MWPWLCNLSIWMKWLFSKDLMLTPHLLLSPLCLWCPISCLWFSAYGSRDQWPDAWETECTLCSWVSWSSQDLLFPNTGLTSQTEVGSTLLQLCRVWALPSCWTPLLHLYLMWLARIQRTQPLFMGATVSQISLQMAFCFTILLLCILKTQQP